MLDTWANTAYRSWKGNMGGGAFVLALFLGCIPSFLFVGLVLRRDSPWVLAGPAVALVAVAGLALRGKRLEADRIAAGSSLLGDLTRDSEEPVLIQSPRWQPALYFLFCLGLLAGGVFDDKWSGGRLAELVFGLLGACVFSFQAAFPSRLRLLRDGFQVTALRRTLPTYAWELSDGFKVWEGPRDFVAFTYRGELLPGRLGGRRLARAVGANASLPSTFGLTGSELCQVLEEARKNALEPRG
jgi:hypothetical protein